MDEITSLICPSCGAKLEIKPNQTTLVCTHCGNEHFIERRGGNIFLEAHAQCPICHRNDRVEKITSILRSQSKDSDLAKNLSSPNKPILQPEPEIPPKPELSPRPDLPSTPALIPHPVLPLKPVFKLRRLNWALLIVGIVLFIAGYTFLAFELSTLINEFEWFDFGMTLFFLVGPIVLGVFLIFTGLNHTKEITINNVDLPKNLTPINVPKRKSRNLAIFVPLFVATGWCLFFSVLIFNNDSDELLIPLLSISLFPAIFALFIYLIVRTKDKIRDSYLPSLKEYHEILSTWEEKVKSIPLEWEMRNKTLLVNWEKSKNRIIENWDFQNKKNMSEWEYKKAYLLNNWQDENASLESKWENATERWNQLYYCHRDDVIFIPGEGTSSPAEDIKAYLSKQS